MMAEFYPDNRSFVRETGIESDDLAASEIVSADVTMGK